MFSLNFLYYSLAIGFLVIVGFGCYTLYYAAVCIKNINKQLDRLDHILTKWELTENRAKLSLLKILGKIIGKGGDK